MEHAKVINGKTIGAWKKYAENEFHYTPMAVVKYITILEEELSKLSQHDVIKNEVAVCCSCNMVIEKEYDKFCRICWDCK
jgi:hypothetical protein